MGPLNRSRHYAPFVKNHQSSEDTVEHKACLECSKQFEQESNQIDYRDYMY